MNQLDTWQFIRFTSHIGVQSPSEDDLLLWAAANDTAVSVTMF